MKYVKGKYVGNGERFITEKGLNESSAQLMPEGTVLYSSRAPIGYIAIAENDICTNQGFKSLVPFLKEVNLYVYYCLIAFTSDIQSRASGTTFKEISGAEFGETIIPLPPLAEQHRIVAKIEELLPYIEKYEQAETALTKLNNDFPELLKKSILQEAVQGKLVPQDHDDEPASVLLERIRTEKQALIKSGKIKKDKHESVIITRDKIPYEIVDGKERCIADDVPFEIPDGWEWCYIGNIAFVTKLAGFEYTKSIYPNLSSEGIPLFKGKNVQNGNLIFEFESYIPEQLSDDLFRSQINRKCLLTPYVGTIGNIAIFDGSFKAHLGSNVGKIELLNPPNPVLLEEYILYYLRSQAGYEQLTKHKKATAQESISIENIRCVLLPIPPLAEQHRIVAKIEELMKYCEML